ncbi:MAG: CDGSH iron-sulfur domain-containing protein [Vicinamibacterales bacterium]
MIRLRRNGPCVIEGDEVIVVDWQGVPYPIDRRPIVLCRCGASSRKPFCDGSHKRVDFDGGPAPSAADSADPDLPDC